MLESYKKFIVKDLSPQRLSAPFNVGIIESLKRKAYVTSGNRRIRYYAITETGGNTLADLSS